MKFRLMFLILAVFLSCKTSSPKLFYGLDEFRLSEAEIFVSGIQKQPKIVEISIVDTRRDKNEFRVNGQAVFNDTIQIDQPNAYSYRKRAKEIAVDENELHQILKNFDAMKVSEFKRESRFYLFPVQNYAMSPQLGYLFLLEGNAKVGDTLEAKSVIGDKIVLKKALQENWFEYTSL